MIVQLWWWKTTPPWSLRQLLTNHRSQQTAAINILYKASPFFWDALISSRDRLPEARRAGATYHSLCCGIWLMSSAWSFALATQTALLLYAFVLFYPVILFHKIAQIVALLILVYTLSAIHYCLEYTPHHNKHTESWTSTPSGSTHINSYT